MSVWDDVVGQENAVAVLRDAVQNPASMTHAWLVTGPPGSGRSLAARAFAAALQCPSGGCGTCHACTTTVAGSHADVTVCRTEAVTLRIEEVRDLVQVAARSPSQGRWRVMIVEDADRMSERTTNVLLKAIEEPPAHTVWVLCAPSPLDVLVTIRSRCRQVGLRVPPVQAVAEVLVRRDGVDPAMALGCAKAAQSHVGIARRLALDSQARHRRATVLGLVSRMRGVSDAVLAAGELVDVAATEAKAAAVERDGVERAALLRSLGVPDGEAPPPKLRSHLKELEADQKRRATRHQRDVLDRAMVDLLSFFRDVLVVQLGASVDLVNEDSATEVMAIAAASTPEETVTRMDAIGIARDRLHANVSPLLAVEAMAVSLRHRDYTTPR